MKNYKGLLRSARNDGENLLPMLGYINEVEFEEASELAIKVSKMLSNFIAYLSSVKGVKG